MIIMHIHNITIQNSPYWTVHFQFSEDIVFENNVVFNPNNATFETPNGDGIDMVRSLSPAWSLFCAFVLFLVVVVVVLLLPLLLVVLLPLV